VQQLIQIHFIELRIVKLTLQADVTAGCP